MITQARLKELLAYNPDTGVFTWLVKSNRKIRIGDIAGHLDGKGYRRIKVEQKRYQAHRLAWLYMTGAWPVAQIDHRNGNKDDNRWDKLREATNAENQQNRVINRNNTSGLMGVCWNRKMGKWQAQIRGAGHRRFLGLFTDPEAAHAAYLAAKAEIHPFQPVPRVV